MNSKDVAKQGQRTEKFGLHSMKAKIVSLVDLELILMAFLLLFLITPKATSLMQQTNKNYLQDVTIAYGMMLETQIENVGLEQALDENNLAKILSEAGLEGIDSSHVFVISKDAIILYHHQSDLIGVSTDSMGNPVVSDIVSQVKAGKKPPIVLI